ncbi:hypothetical protein EBR57_01135 [bacterium]|nr:hypothetical protein [bacterium]
MNHKHIARHVPFPVPPKSDGHRWLAYSDFFTGEGPSVPSNYYTDGLAAAPAQTNVLVQFSGRPLIDVVKTPHLTAIHRAETHTGQLGIVGIKNVLGTATLISPRHILVARHVVNGQRVPNLQFKLLGQSIPVKLVEDGSSFGWDYAILEVQTDKPYSSYVKLFGSQPPVSTFAAGTSSNRLMLYAEDKPINTTHMLTEMNYLPTEEGMSGAIYRDCSDGTGFAIHIKRCDTGLFEGQNSGVLVDELLQSIPTSSALAKIIRGEFEIETLEYRHPFPYFSTALATEIDQGVSQLRSQFREMIQRDSCFQTTHMRIGQMSQSKAEFRQGPDAPAIPLIVEILAQTAEIAHDKILKLALSRRHEIQPLMVIIGLNSCVDDLGSRASNKTLSAIQNKANQLADLMTKHHLPGGIFPFLFKKTTPTEGYTFPYLEGRSIVTLHPGVEALHNRCFGFTSLPVVRWMDGDVQEDVLFEVAQDPSRAEPETLLQTMLAKVSTEETSVANGGYEWAVSDIPLRLQELKRLRKLKLNGQIDVRIVELVKRAVEIINKSEGLLREELIQTFGVKAVYWPEPNLYMQYDVRSQGALNAMEWVEKKPTEAQQKESTFVISSQRVKNDTASYGSGLMMPSLACVKPIKEKLDTVLTVLWRELNKSPGQRDGDQIRNGIIGVLQTHLNPQNVEKAADWNGVFITDKTDLENRCDKYMRDCLEQIVAL